MEHVPFILLWGLSDRIRLCPGLAWWGYLAREQGCWAEDSPASLYAETSVARKEEEDEHVKVAEGVVHWDLYDPIWGIGGDPS